MQSRGCDLLVQLPLLVLDGAGRFSCDGWTSGPFCCLSGLVIGTFISICNIWRGIRGLVVTDRDCSSTDNSTVSICNIWGWFCSVTVTD